MKVDVIISKQVSLLGYKGSGFSFAVQAGNGCVAVGDSVQHLPSEATRHACSHSIPKP